ncbi:MAG TPA: hypothetical protein VJ958_05325 [Atribacterota bacterium]|nr:hypothetical protein [Atribacterota bacterium]
MVADRNYSRSGQQKIQQSMPDRFEIINNTDTHTGASSGFMKLSASSPAFSVLKINGVSVTNASLLPEDVYILGNVTEVKLSSGAIAIWRD